MLDFPKIPIWWGNKFVWLKKGYSKPDTILGFDTETNRGEVLCQQFVTLDEKKIIWCNTDTVLDKFLEYLERFGGYTIIYCFNAKFDLALLLRKFIDRFLADDFEVRYNGWVIKVFCSKNWYAFFQKEGYFVRFIDISNYFFGSLDTVSQSFGLSVKKLERPEQLGYKQFTHKDKYFVDYALMDAELCYEMGVQIVKMHAYFDIPISTSSANFAEKVFRRRFLKEGQVIQFPPFSPRRYAEIVYHGGKNGYYLDSPSLVHNCYEYDFNAAYGYAMYSLPSFLQGNYRRVTTFNEKHVGIYHVKGVIKPCKYGILYDNRFNYFRVDSPVSINAMITSFELQEALDSNEFQINQIEGWVWVPSTEDNPLKKFAAYFWEQKNKMHKGDVRYLFYKLCLNSLYGKWIQRNPGYSGMAAKMKPDGGLEFKHYKDVSGGLYHPFIASLITGMTRARLHQYEHKLNAIESSTDSVKSRDFEPTLQKVYFGRMQLEQFECKECQKQYKNFNGLFVRNRLNLLMCKKGHILKSALHGFWGRPPILKELWERRGTEYTVERMPLIREGLKQSGKNLFETMSETRSLNIDWSTYKEVK